MASQFSYSIIKFVHHIIALLLTYASIFLSKSQKVENTYITSKPVFFIQQICFYVAQKCVGA